MAAPIAAYSFDAGAGSTILDESGNGRTLTVGSGSFTQTSKNGLAAFESIGGGATTGASGTVTAVSGTACSIMGWLKPSTLAAGGIHLAFGAMQSNGNTDFGVYTQRGDFSTSNVLQGNARIGGGLVPANGSALTVGVWAHVALTFDGTTLKLFKDGSQVASAANSGSLANTGTLYVAGIALEGTARVSVDDVRYFNTDESSRVAEWMNTPVGDTGFSGFF